MILVSVEVSSGGAARFRVEVRAESLERAVRLARVRHPGCGIEVLFPIDPQAFFSLREPDGSKQGEEGLSGKGPATARDGSSTNHVGRRKAREAQVPELARDSA